jgi:DNA-binding NarL/FixJ family response regulator
VTELVSADPQVRIVANLEPNSDLWADFERSTADLMICSFGEPEMNALWKTSLAHRPPYAVLNLTDDHQSGHLYALYPERATVEELTGTSLLETLAAHMRSLLRADGT